jgi:hypothetical protein
MDSKFKPILTELLSKPEKKSKELFKLDSEQLVEMSDFTRQEVCKMLDSQDLTKLSHIHHADTKN